MNITCFVRGHDTNTINGERNYIVHQKGVREWTFYSGVLTYCTREKCKWEHYVGPITPYAKTFKTLRGGILKIDGAQYRIGDMVRGVHVLSPVRPTRRKMSRKAPKKRVKCAKSLK